MEKYEYLETREGKRSRMLYNLRRRIRLSYPERFIVKKRRSKKVSEQIVLNTIEQMKKTKRQSFRGNIACSMRINSMKNNLPETYHIAKNYLDLINKTWNESMGIVDKNNFNRIPYNDDNQISYLSIAFSTFETNKLTIKLSNFGKFLNDIFLAFELGREKERPYCDGDEEIDWNWFHEYYKNDEKRLRKQLGDKKYEKGLSEYKKLKSHNLWSYNKLKLSDVYHILGYKGNVNRYKYNIPGKGGNLVENMCKGTGKMHLKFIIDSPYSISLPDPCASNFSKNANNAIMDFKRTVLKNQDFNIPVGVQILYRPFSRNPQKDLDNISREILQNVKNCFKNPCYESFTHRYPKSYKNATPCYEAIKLPFEKGERGLLILRFYSLFMNPVQSLWDEISPFKFEE